MQDVRDIEIADMTIGDVPISRVFVLRVGAPRTTEETRALARRFERRVEELIAA
jgi:hypothetical protein